MLANWRILLFGTFMLGLIMMFQNCSDVQFSGKDETKIENGPTGIPPGPHPEEGSQPNPPEEVGLIGGHFDLDTASAVYPLAKGETDAHVHEYDDKYDTTQVDFFAMEEKKLGEIQDQIPGDNQFYLIVANAQLSPGAILEINGQSISVVAYQQKVDAFLKGDSGALVTYSLDGLAGTTRLTSFRLLFQNDALSKGGLVPTQTGCVRNNDPGKNGEYRNGALTIQAVNTAGFIINPETWTASLDAEMLWEATVFWHKEKAGCY